ncbi:YeeE/YedE family protein [Sphingomicrobium sediminis]|uniref:YeeE/YedE family protein n=1 Tax=Sphingomicrobium sediminis TaxID=2950949 RepID=A0A9X2EEC1_9SPHN|nr:YeeE/YedE thiosulfate transporter family protein [Sphingomicrobium sediminis]MCM8556410.1 YeeE/YedE family protein [Sphingomicrobium sediminis]
MTIPGFPDAMPVEGFIGGLLIGLAAAIMLLGIGRIAGVSGIAARATGLSEGGPPRGLAIIFLIGLMIGPFIAAAINGPIEATFPPQAWAMVAGGLLVGFGTRLGSGCTSGHGVCGMSRLSRRSISATLTFIGSGVVTVAIVNALGGGWS